MFQATGILQVARFRDGRSTLSASIERCQSAKIEQWQ
jgi:hypothetical protein